MLDADTTNFEREVIETSHEVPVLVEFWAPGCAPCAALGPVLQSLERAFAGGFKLVKVDTSTSPALAAAFRVRSVPHVIAFHDGKAAASFTGAFSESQVRAFIHRLLPRPHEEILASARAQLAAGRPREAADLFATGLAIDPSRFDARADYVRTLVTLGRAADAERAFLPAADRARNDLQWAALARLVEAARVRDGDPRPVDALREAVAGAPSDPAARLRLAQALMLESDWRGAMDEALALVAIDRRWGDDAGRRLVLACFELCPDATLVREYRRRLSSGLFKG